ncbi:hypothetical protein SDC9_71622 [bioreactor metagenome]|uniref:Uncharacterized protein n=1 Tax=bioreactor metagenome TaxID=1076179 RepID=A0A644Y932_9ZZZZ
MMVGGIAVIETFTPSTGMEIIHNGTVVLIIRLIDKGGGLDGSLRFFREIAALDAFYHHGSNLAICVMVF